MSTFHWMEDHAQAGGAKFLIGVTGAQGVGKSTFCRALRNRLAEKRPVVLLEGLGDRLRLAGVPLGRNSNASTIAAVFAAHRNRETEAGPGLIILDRCMVDALAYTRVLGVTEAADLTRYEAATREAVRGLSIVIHLRLSPPFAAAGHAGHETRAIRDGTAREISSIIDELQLRNLTLDASDPRAIDDAATAVLAAMGR